MELKQSQKQVQVIQQTLSSTDHRAAKAESNSAKLQTQVEDILKEFQMTKQAYSTLQQKYDKVRHAVNMLIKSS